MKFIHSSAPSFLYSSPPFSILSSLFRISNRIPTVMATQSPAAAAAASENTRKDEDYGDESQETTFLSRRWCCFWSFPCSASLKSEKWERISASETESPGSVGRSLWGRGVNMMMKAREWSELVAGPKCNTFIRRFNRTGARSKAGKFQYDPLSYALNFDEGPGQSGQFEDDRIFRGFSSRYAVNPVQHAL